MDGVRRTRADTGSEPIPASRGRGCRTCGARYIGDQSRCALDGSEIEDDIPDLLLGLTIDNYHVIEPIGEGGMGRIYRARHVVLEQDYALKVLLGDFAIRPNAATRFLREAQAAARIDHPNIVRVVYSGSTKGGLPFLVMDLLHGSPLSDRIERGALTTKESARICLEISRGLAAIHAAGFLHRDIKPSNIMLTEGGAKILDLGLVRAIESDELGPTVTQDGQLLGTPLYLAPEVIRGDESKEARDLYALGAVIYEMLTSVPPFTGSTREVLWQHVTREPDPVPGPLGALALELLRKEPEQRPKSASEVTSRLAKILQNLEFEEVRSSFEDSENEATKKLSPLPTVDSRSSSQLESLPPPSNNRLPWILGATMGCLILGWLIGKAALLPVQVPTANQGVDASRRPREENSIPNREKLDTIPTTRVQSGAPIADTGTPAGGPDTPTARQATSTADPGTQRTPEAETRTPDTTPRPPEGNTRLPKSRSPEAENPRSDMEAESLEVTITSEPPGATVEMTGGTLGKTPVTVYLPSGQTIPLTFRLAGHADRVVEISPRAGFTNFRVQLEGNNETP